MTDILQGLPAKTYNLIYQDKLFHITIVDEIQEDGSLLPKQLFINSLYMAEFYYLVAISNLINGFLLHNALPEVVREALYNVADPVNGNYWKKGVLFPSLISEISNIFAKHCENLK